MLRAILVSIAVLVFSSTSNSQTIYKYIDENGNVAYSDEFRGGENIERLKAEDFDKITTMEAPKRSQTTTVHKKTVIYRQNNNSNKSAKIQKCKKYREEIEKITDRLRQPYTVSTGNSLRAKKRQLSSLVSSECR